MRLFFAFPMSWVVRHRGLMIQIQCFDGNIFLSIFASLHKVALRDINNDCCLGPDLLVIDYKWLLNECKPIKIFCFKEGIMFTMSSTENPYFCEKKPQVVALN